MSPAETEYLIRSAAMRGFSRGSDWRRENHDPTVAFTEDDIIACENAILAEMRAEGVIQ